MKKITKFLSIIISICVISSMASFNVLAEDAQTASTIVTTTAIHSWQLDGNNNANKLEDITSATTNIIAKSVNNRYPIYEFELPNKEAVKSVKFVTTPTYLGSTSANYVHLYAANLDNVTAKTYDSMLEVVNNAKTSAISYYNTINKTDNEINNHEKIGIEAGIDPTNKTTLYQPYQEWATERGNITEKTAEFDITDYVKQEEVYGKTLGVIIQSYNDVQFAPYAQLKIEIDNSTYLNELKSKTTVSALNEYLTSLSAVDQQMIGINTAQYTKFAYPAEVAEEILNSNFTNMDEFVTAFNNAIAANIETITVDSTRVVSYRISSPLMRVVDKNSTGNYAMKDVQTHAIMQNIPATAKNAITAKIKVYRNLDTNINTDNVSITGYSAVLPTSIPNAGSYGGTTDTYNQWGKYLETYAETSVGSLSVSFAAETAKNYAGNIENAQVSSADITPELLNALKTNTDLVIGISAPNSSIIQITFEINLDKTILKNEKMALLETLQTAKNEGAAALDTAITSLTEAQAAILGIKVSDYTAFEYTSYIAEKIAETGFDTVTEFKTAFDAAINAFKVSTIIDARYLMSSSDTALRSCDNNGTIKAYKGSSAYFTYNLSDTIKIISGTIAAIRTTDLYNGLDTININGSFSGAMPFIPEIGKEYNKNSQEYSDWNTFINNTTFSYVDGMSLEFPKDEIASEIRDIPSSIVTLFNNAAKENKQLIMNVENSKSQTNITKLTLNVILDGTVIQKAKENDNAQFDYTVESCEFYNGAAIIKLRKHTDSAIDNIKIFSIGYIGENKQIGSIAVSSFKDINYGDIDTIRLNMSNTAYGAKILVWSMPSIRALTRAAVIPALTAE